MSSKSDSGSEDATFSAYSCQKSDRKSNGSEHYDDDVCRDFMRNVCSRGSRCKYRHPDITSGDKTDPPPRRDLTFCHDYQNNGCTRPSCKFLHCSRDEEEYFHRSGLLPTRLNHSRSSSQKSDLPLCRDFIKGECNRGSKCRYRHMSDSDRRDRSPEDDRRRERSGGYEHAVEYKRRRLDDDYDDRFPPRQSLSFSLLEDENKMLKRKIEEMKKQVSDLQAINEVLLEQNARFRVSKTATLHVTPTQHSLPALAAVAVGGPVNGAVGGVSHVSPAHGQAGSMVVTPSLTQQVALNSDLATQHALQARLAPPSAPPSAVTITQNIPLGLTQSNMAVSMATMGGNMAVSMATMGAATAQQLQVAHSLTQNLGAPPTSLVSYPIMSQNMRSAVEPSSLTH